MEEAKEVREEIVMDPMQKQALDDTFDAFTLLAGGNYVTLMHVNGGFTRYSAAAVELLGLPGEYIPNGAMDWNDYLHPEDRKRYMDVMMPLANGETMTYDITYRVRTKTGVYHMFRAVGAVLRGEDGKPNMIGGALINEGLIESTDPITVLRNQYAFNEDLTAMLKKDQKTVAILLGVNRLDQINQVYGYGHGNRVLQQIAWVLQESVGERGTVYRLDGAKFAIVTDTISEQEMSAIYDSIRVKLQRGIRIGDVRHNLTVNGGMLAARGFRIDVGAMYACLRQAYNESKKSRNGELVDYNGQLTSDAARSLEIVAEVRNNVLEGCRGFSLRYQPVMSAHTGKAIGVEALLRWRSEKYGDVSPMEYLPVLEQDFVFEELGGWILRQAMTDGLEFLKKEPDFLMGINLSPTQLEDEYFIDTLQQMLRKTGFPAKNLCLELTKGCRLLDIERVKAFVSALRARDVRIILDDFGSGVDSLEFLKALSVDYIKFDDKIVKHVADSEKDRSAIRSLAEIAGLYGREICVKGIESDVMSEIVSQCPISSMQGRLFSSEVSNEDLLERI